MSYYYLVSSLPMLKRGERPALSLEALRFQCEGVLSEPDFQEVDRILQHRFSSATTPSGRCVQGIEVQLRNAIARNRAHRRKIDPKPFLRDQDDFDSRVEQAVADASGKENPREREDIYDQCRWDLAGDAVGEDPFGLGAVLAYAVRLHIVTRWESMNEIEGKHGVDETVTRQIRTANRTVESK